MAELKQHPFEYNNTPLPREEQQLEVKQHPKLIKNKFSKLEKVIVSVILTVFLMLAVATVRLTTTIAKSEETISQIQSDISTKEHQISELEQQKNELSSVERIKQAAEKSGLEAHEESIRKVTK